MASPSVSQSLSSQVQLTLPVQSQARHNQVDALEWQVPVAQDPVHVGNGPQVNAVEFTVPVRQTPPSALPQNQPAPAQAPIGRPIHFAVGGRADRTPKQKQAEMQAAFDRIIADIKLKHALPADSDPEVNISFYPSTFGATTVQYSVDGAPRNISIYLDSSYAGFEELGVLLQENKMVRNTCPSFSGDSVGATNGKATLVRQNIPFLMQLSTPLKPLKKADDEAHLFDEFRKLYLRDILEKYKPTERLKVLHNLAKKEAQFALRLSHITRQKQEREEYQKKLYRDLQANPELINTHPEYSSQAFDQLRKEIDGLAVKESLLLNIDAFAIGWAISHPSRHTVDLAQESIALKEVLKKRKQGSYEGKGYYEKAKGIVITTKLSKEEEQYAQDVVLMKATRSDNIEYFSEHQDSLERRLFINSVGSPEDVAGFNSFLADLLVEPKQNVLRGIEIAHPFFEEEMALLDRAYNELLPGFQANDVMARGGVHQAWKDKLRELRA